MKTTVNQSRFIKVILLHQYVNGIILQRTIKQDGLHQDRNSQIFPDDTPMNKQKG